MQIYHYHSQTGEFISVGFADESPREPGVYLIPAHATHIAPPDIPTGQTAVFDGDAWSLAADHRGQHYWHPDGTAGEITEIGQTVASVGGITEPPPSPAHVWADGAWQRDPDRAAMLISARWADIRTERERRITSGGYRVGDKWYHSDILSRTQQLGLVMMGSGLPASMKWKTMDGSFVAMTMQLASQIFAAAAASDQAIFEAAEAHRLAMEASDDPAGYDFSGGWPVVFGE